MNHDQMVDEAATAVLANHEILLAAPGGAKLNSFYPTPAESTTVIAQSVNNCGQLFVQSNSKRIGGSADFMISTPNIMDVPQLNLSLTVGAYDGANATERSNAYLCTFQDGWGFDLIERIEVSFAKSNISNLQLQGHALRDWSLLQCKNEDERKEMMHLAGKAEVWNINSAKKLSASIPISFLFMRAAGGVEGGFGIDGRALHGPITFQIHFRTLNYILAPAASYYDRSVFPSEVDAGSGIGTTGGAAFPSSILLGSTGMLPESFDQLELTMRTYQLMDGVFSVAKALEINPSLTYSIPGLWLNTYTQQVNVDSNGNGSININSIPAGMLQAIIVRARPVNQQSFSSYSYSTLESAATDALVTGDKGSLLNYNAPSLTSSAVRRSGTLTGDLENYQSGVTPFYHPYRPFSLPFEELELDYSGQAIFRAKSQASYDAFLRNVFNDDLKTSLKGMPQHLSVLGQTTESTLNFNAAGDTTYNGLSTSIRNIGNEALVDLNTQVMVIPLCHNGNDVFRKRGFENLPHYSGSTLQLKFKVAAHNTYSSSGRDRDLCYSSGKQSLTNASEDISYSLSVPNPLPEANRTNRWRGEESSQGGVGRALNRQQHVAFSTGPTEFVFPADQPSSTPRERVLFNNNPNSTGATAFNNDGGVIQLDLTYVIASLFQITNGTCELQL